MPDTVFPSRERQEPLEPLRLAEAVRILTMPEPTRQRFAVPAPWVQRERILFIAGPTAIHADAEAFASRQSCDLVVIDRSDPLGVRIDFAVFIDAIALHLWFTDYRLWRSPEDQPVRFVPRDPARSAWACVRDGRISGASTEPFARDAEERHLGCRLADAALLRLVRGR